MRTDRSARSVFSAFSAAFATGITLGVLLLTGCPGTLAHPEHFLLAVAGASSGDAAAPVAGSDAGTEAGPGPDSGPCGDVVTRIFIPSCGGTGCHGAVGAQQDLDLVSPGVADRVVGVQGTGCISTLADPTDPEGSLIYQKLLPTPPCGSPMPLARPALSDEDMACVLAWIAAQ
jgi:hypothetical protein